MQIPSSHSVTPKREVNSRKKAIASVSLPAGNANVPAAQIHANSNKYIIRTLLMLGGLMLLGIGFVEGRSQSGEVAAAAETPGTSEPPVGGDAAQ
jgi:phage baseplate assembly protein gpV